MATTKLRWIGNKEFVGVDSTNHSVVVSTPADGTGIKPSDLLLIALSACSAVDVVEIIQKKRLSLTSLEIHASGVQDADPPWTFREIHLLYILIGKNIPIHAVEQAIHLAEEKYCSVAATIRATAKISTEIKVIEQS